MSDAKVPILLVDDNPGDLLALKAVLSSPAYELVSVDCGQKALEALEKRDFAVVLLDSAMHDITGIETARALRSLSKEARPTPIIFVTGVESSPACVLDAYAQGAVDFVQKPFEPIILRSKVAVFAELYRARLDAVIRSAAAPFRPLGDRTRVEPIASEERFHQLVDAVSDYAIFSLDATGHVATWNPGVEKIKGHTADEILGRHFSVFYIGEDLAAGKPEHVLEMVRREGRFEEEGWRVRKDGSRFWASVLVTALRDARGELTGFAKVTRDLSERRTAEENERRLAHEQFARAASEAERKRLLALIQQLPAIVNVLRGPDLVFDFVHPKAMAALGGRRVIGRPLTEAIPECRDHPDIVARVRRVYETGEPSVAQGFPLRLVKDGVETVTYWDSSYLPIFDAFGSVEGVMTFDLEVTPSVLARQEMERVNRAKDEFLATMSHELRTPLNAIRGWAMILRRKPREEGKLERGLEVIERNARTQTRLVSDLLDVSRIMTGKLELQVQMSAVFPLIAAAVEVVKPAADGKGVRLVVDIDPEIGEALVDPNRLQQIVWNLLSNAVRCTPRGGRVTVTADRTDSGVLIRVTDTGIGIAANLLPHVFERFAQADSSTTRVHGGLGLGLSIVRYLVEAHGGSVEAASEGPDQGATFSVKMPVRPAGAKSATPHPAGAVPTNHAPEPCAPESVANLEGVRVLIVDDDADSLEVLRMVLASARAAVTTAACAREAFEQIDASAPFDIIISDIGMPEVDGYSFLRSVRSGRVGADVPAIALTAYTRSEDVELAKKAGFQEHLSKPVDQVHLLETVRTWSAQSPHRRDAAALSD